MSDDNLENDDIFGSEILDLEAFNQLLSMDDEGDEDHEFSRDIVDNYFDQARGTFSDMDKAFAAKDLGKLSSLGHFLKGSSATIGIKKVQECCKHIQYLGKLQGANGEGVVEAEEALRLIWLEMTKGKEEYQKAEEFLRFFYEADPGDDDDEDDDDDDED
ncbi:Phosphorelay intermediate protein [Coemansia sp. IMI 203386]|nr:Phosphorelay intermediate protein [Coemansia sp. IMI 203386]